MGNNPIGFQMRGVQIDNCVELIDAGVLRFSLAVLRQGGLESRLRFRLRNSGRLGTFNCLSNVFHRALRDWLGAQLTERLMH